MPPSSYAVTTIDLAPGVWVRNFDANQMTIESTDRLTFLGIWPPPSFPDFLATLPAFEAGPPGSATAFGSAIGLAYTVEVPEPASVVLLVVGLVVVLVVLGLRKR